VQERTDYFGNVVDQFAILTPYTRMCVTSRSDVELDQLERSLDPDASPAWEGVAEGLLYRGKARYSEATEFSYPSPFTPVGPEVEAFARDLFEPDRPLLAATIALMHRIHEEFTFDPEATSVATPITEVLAERRGVCQDFAHLQIAALRSLGLPVRYVSGYLLTDPPEGQPRLVGADASHAWVSVWCPVHGWVDLDPTNDVLPSIRHITLAGKSTGCTWLSAFTQCPRRRSGGRPWSLLARHYGSAPEDSGHAVPLSRLTVPVSVCAEERHPRATRSNPPRRHQP
jgi:transglutaminase-like putative cysteine protease